MLFYSAFRRKCLTYLKVLNERSESESYTVAAGNNSPFVNTEAHISIPNNCNLLHTTIQESNHLDKDATVLGAAIGCVSLRAGRIYSAIRESNKAEVSVTLDRY